MRHASAFTTSRLTRGALALAVGALVALPGCGSSSSGKPLPQRDANKLLALLQVADAEASSGRCGRAQAKAQQAARIADALPGTVDKNVRQGLIDGLARLQSLIQTQCQAPQTQTTPTNTATTTTQTTTTTPTTTTDTTTNTTPTTTGTDTTPTTTTTTGTGTSTTPTSTGNGGVPGTGTGAAGTGATGTGAAADGTGAAGK